MRKRGFTLVEIMIVVAIIGLLAAIAIPSFLKARENSRKNACINNLRQIHSGKEQWAIEYGGTNGYPMTWVYVGEYIRGGATKVFCPASTDKNCTNNYLIGSIGTDPVCNIVPSGSYGHIL